MARQFKKNFMQIDFASDRNLDLFNDQDDQDKNGSQKQSSIDEYKRSNIIQTKILTNTNQKLQNKKEQVMGPTPNLNDSDSDSSDSSDDDEINKQNNYQNINQEEQKQEQNIQDNVEKINENLNNNIANEKDQITEQEISYDKQEQGNDEELDDYSDSSSNQEENKARDDGNNEEDDHLEGQLDRTAMDSLKELKQNQKDALFQIPCSHEVLLKGHTKSITALTLEKSGTRIITGGNDTQIRMWDFNGMNKSMNSFRILTPIPGCVIKNISYSVDQQELLVVANSIQPKVITREGKNISQCLKGDMYLKDMNQTKGHTQMVNDGTFSPADNTVFATCSNDCTIRLFDRSQKLHGIEQQMAHKLLIKCKDQKGMKTSVSAVNFTQNGQLVFGACQDGSLQGFNLKKGVFNRPDIHALNAFQQGTDVSKIISFSDNFRLVTRNLDHTMKLWDIRQIKRPLNVWYNLTNYQPGSKVCLSHDEKYIITGTSVGNTPDEKFSKLLFFDAQTFDQVADINFGEHSVTDIHWHKSLNQIFVGSTDNMVHILFDPKKSKNGALLCLNKQTRQPQPDDFDFNYQNIITPHALPLFKEPKRNKKRLYEQSRLDPEKSKRPQLPQKGPRGEQKGGSSTVMQHYMRNIFKTVDQRSDPQKALLALDALAKQNPQYISNAYAETQPEQIFDYTPDNAEQQLLSSIQKICPACGLKICSCQKKFTQQ